MGTGQSALKGLEIEEKAVEITDFWTHHSANIDGSNPQSLSVFISEPSLHSTASFGKPSPLEKNAKNLMLHRHPCILKYVSSWPKGSKFFLATEEVKPLVQVIGGQTTLQICIGLYSILRALLFLHEKASASHNNICSSAIYVTTDGCWKLGGLEYLCRFAELTPAYFRKIKNYRYEKAISPEEDESMTSISTEPASIDRYAFGVLAEDVLRLKNADDVPGLTDFKDFCKERLKTTDTSAIASLSSLLNHPFFSHDFMKIHAFLTELPLKNETEKEEFFLNVVQKLESFPEKIVAEQLGKLLLSRLVLLDRTAQTKLLPFVLKPKNEQDCQDQGLFTVPTFKVHLIPKLLQMFCVRDASIRLLLLSHLNSFVHVFEKEELKCRVLPELLVGIKDNDDYLVGTTLRALADLIPILGAATVIGGSRAKLFTDGRPKKLQRLKKSNHNINASPEATRIADRSMLSLPERPSPDGGEDRAELSFSNTEEENWSDWEGQEVQKKASDVKSLESAINGSLDDNFKPLVSIYRPDLVNFGDSVEEILIPPKIVDKIKYSKKPISDISELDIKNSKSMNHKDEFDFFTDMEPVIQKPQVLHVEEVTHKNIFDVNLTNQSADTEEDNGWGDDLNDWDVDDSVESKE
ncbi:protein-associating with the carboxyl-terminal domain of ezrin [Belonocnema kinseyi]|uniref:protein-associating with the carboxyl-terminal domain of ezrin n=1 Tax=Belonocnema kinseyi TaxID=2817044 RepID=UPI00143D4C03|nr:protein-associating with the carboxyl-terminal domain of ezrin [Belonocnema kinseyi]